MYIFVPLSGIYINNEYASINRELVETSVFRAQLTRSTMFNSDWAKQMFLSNVDQTTALQESGEKLVTRTYVWPFFLKQTADPQ